MNNPSLDTPAEQYFNMPSVTPVVGTYVDLEFNLIELTLILEVMVSSQEKTIDDKDEGYRFLVSLPSQENQQLLERWTQFHELRSNALNFNTQLSKDEFCRKCGINHENFLQVAYFPSIGKRHRSSLKFIYVSQCFKEETFATNLQNRTEFFERLTAIINEQTGKEYRLEAQSDVQKFQKELNERTVL